VLPIYTRRFNAYIWLGVVSVAAVVTELGQVVVFERVAAVVESMEGSGTVDKGAAAVFV